MADRVQYHIPDWNAGTEELSFEEEAAYRKLCDYFYLTDGHLKDDDHLNARRLKISTRKYRTLRAALIKAGKLEEKDGCLHSQLWQRLRKRKPISPAVRGEVWEMTDGTCWYCGVDMTRGDNSDPRQFTVDHVMPFVAGGADDIANFVPACRDCNVRKGAAH